MTDQPPPSADQAVRVWVLMQAFVTSQARNRERPEAFDFVAGSGASPCCSSSPRDP